MKKSKERLDAEATYQMTWRERVENAWFYYKWWLIGSAAVLGLLLMFVQDIRSNVAPDYTVGLLSPGYLPDALTQELTTALTPYADDRNGDGQVVVQVASYNMGLGEESPRDPAAHAAAMTRLSADIQLGDSMLFITDRVEEYQELLQLFAYNDGSLLPPEGPYERDKLGVPLPQLPAFAALGQGEEISRKPEEFWLLKRSITGTPLEQKEKSVAYFDASMQLFDRLTEK